MISLLYTYWVVKRKLEIVVDRRITIQMHRAEVKWLVEMPKSLAAADLGRYTATAEILHCRSIFVIRH
jgi:hypothetical protein